MNLLFRAFFAPLVALLILGGCSSGGDSITRTTGPGGPTGPTGPGGGVAAFREVSQAQVEAQRVPEYLAQRGLDTVGAAWMYARGQHNSRLDPANYGDGSGAGITVGVIDDGLDNLHREFAGRLHSSSVLLYPHDPATSTASIVNPLHLDSPADILTGIASYPVDPCLSCAPPEVCDEGCVVQFADGSYMRLPLRPVLTSLDVDTGTIVLDSPGDMSHGTRVTSVLAARRDNNGMHGVAHNANILFRSMDFGAPSPLPPIPIRASLEEVLTAAGNAFEPAFQLMIDEGVPVVNMSLGAAAGAIDAVDANGMPIYTAEILQNTLGGLVNVLAQTATDAAERSIFVLAAGNDGTASSPNVMAGLPLHFDSLKGHFIAVVAIDQRDARVGSDSGRIASFSNRCGVAAEWCIAAPGGGVGTAVPVLHNSDGTLVTSTGMPGGENAIVFEDGTSFAAPMVAGAIASLMEFFNGRLAGDEIVQRIFATANDDGEYAKASIYGHGLLDLKAATEPVGGQRMLSGTGLAGRSAPLGASRLWSGTAVGDAWQRAASGLALATFDELDAPFPVALGEVLPARYDMHERAMRRWQSFSDPVARVGHGSGKYAGGTAVMQYLDGGPALGQWRWSSGLHPGYSAAGARPDALARAALPPWPALAQDGISLGLQMHLGGHRMALAAFHGRPPEPGAGPAPGWQPRNSGMILSWSPGASGGAPDDLADIAGTVELGWLGERRGFAGNLGTGALGTGQNSGTVFFGGRVGMRLGAWRAQASGWLGNTAASGRGDAALRHTERIISSSFSTYIRRNGIWRPGDQLSLSLSQALRVESGAARLRYAASRTSGREVVWRELHVGLEPSGRELSFSLDYRLALGDGCSSAGAALGMVRDSGHSSAGDRSLMARLRLCL